MTITFVARCVGIDDVVGYDCLSALIIENPGGDGHVLHFEASLAQPGPHEIAAGNDTYCLIIDNDLSVHGGIAEISIRNRVLRVALTADASDRAGLDAPAIEAILDTNDKTIDQVRTALKYIVHYGREEARPTIIEL